MSRAHLTVAQPIVIVIAIVIVARGRDSWRVIRHT
jgi:hypothetical protein